MTTRKKVRTRRRFGSVDQPSRGGLVRLRYRVDGERHTEWAMNFEDADRRLSAIETDLRRGKWTAPRAATLTFNEVADMWLATKETPSTIARDKSVLKCWWRPRIGGRPIGSITRADLQAAVDAMTTAGRMGKTVETNWRVAQAVMNFAKDEEIIDRAPVKRIRLPKIRPTDHVEPSAARFLALVDALPAEFRLIALLLGVCGMRWSEVRSLRRCDVDVEAGVIIVRNPVVEVDGRFFPSEGKTDGSLGRVAMPKEVVSAYRVHLMITGRRSADSLLFTAPRGGMLRSSNFRLRVWQPAIERAMAQGYTARELRQISSALMREAGASEQEVGARLRHTRKSAVTSDLYGGITIERHRAVNEGIGDVLGRARKVNGGSEDTNANSA